MDFPLVASPSEMLDTYLDVLFNEKGDIADVEDLKERMTAFAGLAELFLSNKKSNYTFDDLEFEPHALKMMLGRFQRDAFGVGRLWTRIDQMVGAKKIASAVATELKDEILGLGLRIGSEQPRKTRIAAVFSLWMSVFRPVRLKEAASKNDPNAGSFCPALNFFIATSYLGKFGKILIGTDFQEHTRRIVHDFTYRAINLSSLELLYCGIFRSSAEAKSRRKK